MKKGSRSFFIAEAGVNHNGDLSMAKMLIRAASAAGADAVKFQTFVADKLVKRGTPKAEYQKRTTGYGDQQDMLKALELSFSDHEELYAECQRAEIEFMSTAFDEESLDMLVKLGIQRIKVPSGELTNLPLLKKMAATGLPMIVSTGMATMDEVVAAVECIKLVHEPMFGTHQVNDLVTLLHCTSNYPALVGDVNLNAMLTMKKETGLAVGYSDHTVGSTIAIAAVAMGASLVEKHFTLDKKLPGPDHLASIEPDELKFLIGAIRDVEEGFGSGEKKPTVTELPIRSLVRRSICSARELAKGTVIKPDDLVLLRPGTGLSPTQLDLVVGRTLNKSIAAEMQLTWSDFEK